MKIKHRFFGKDCVINRDLADHADLRRALDEEKIFAQAILFLNQIHGSEVVAIDSAEKIHGNQALPKADALVTNLPNIVLGVVTADCSPILFSDSKNKIIAAAHAGWRGAKSGVIAATVAEMKKLGAQNIKAMIGPMIHQKSYEVSRDFFDDFAKEDLVNKSFFENGVSPGKYWFNLPAYIEKKLQESGIKKIESSEIDTYEQKQHFFSFRRSTHRGEKDCGRNVSVIAIN